MIMSHRPYALLALSLAVVSCGRSPSTGATPAQPGVLITNAIVIDGTGSPGRRVAVRVIGDRIAAIGDLQPANGDQVVDAHGLVLTPGFIDTHTHADDGLDDHPEALAVVSQGITTIIGGQDGGSSLPLSAYFTALEKKPAAVNVGMYVGHGSVRDSVMGADFKRAASPAEVQRMADLVANDMRAGAIGLSSGLEYDPGIYSDRSEVIALAKVAAQFGGRYISHIRSEDYAFWQAIDEIIAIGREAKLPVQISHAKLAMRSIQGQADSLVRLLDRARASGVDITADIYPYLYWHSTLTAGDGSDRSVSKTGFGTFPFVTHQHQYGWQNDITIPAGALTIALERREERVDTDAGFAVRSRDTNSLTGVYRIDKDAHALQVNVRHDDSTQFGARTTGAIAWGYRFVPDWRVTASAGTAFKVPTFNDLYFPGFSNPDLRPETSRNVEVGLHALGDASGVRWDAHATAYHNRVRDLIVFQCDADFNCAPDNVADATLEGVTLAGRFMWRDTTINASVDFQSPTDSASGRLLPRRARRHGVVTLSQPYGRALFIVEVVGSSERFDDAENLRRLAGYGIVNVSLEWAIDARTTLFVRGDNVFDRDYELAADFATGGARVFAGVRWRM